ncbi:MAG TPA: ATP-binding protein [Verrucomicrobiae bacterium]|jgi:light-regulated signal transduction histidine kinase (bacteriophytochrome)
MSEESTSSLQATCDQLSRALADRSAQLENATREFEQFAYSVSHDLRAPLRAVEGFAQILSEDYGDVLDDDGKRAIKILVSGARKASLLLEDLLTHFRISRNPFSADFVNMNLLVAEKKRELEVAAGKAEIRVGNLPEAWGDAKWLGTAIEQLLRNAIKFSRNQEKPLIEITGKMEARETIYSIRDNGVGFDAKYADRLFGVFQRLHGEEEFEGRGIGLAIVMKVQRRHGGNAWAEGKIGQGATFYISVPNREAVSGS